MICKRWLARTAAWTFAVVTVVLGGCIPSSKQGGVDHTLALIDARTELRQAADGKDPVTRTHAIEALAQIEGVQAGGIFKQALGDEMPTVRFAAAMAIGDVKYKPALETLLAMAKDKKAEPDRRVFCAVIYALHQLGNYDYAGELGTLLFDKEWEVRANAAMAMGKMGESSAIAPLKTLQGDEKNPTVELQLVESLALLGDEKSAGLLEAYTKRPFLDDRLVAIAAMVKVRSARGPHVMRRLLRRTRPTRERPRVRVAAAGAMSEFGYFDQEGYDLCIKAAGDPTAVMRRYYGTYDKINPVEIHSLQRLAAMSLGSMRRSEAVTVLHPLLKSSDGSVRIAAAMSILKILRVSTAPTAEEPAQKQDQSSQDPKKAPSPIRPKLHTSGGKN